MRVYPIGVGTAFARRFFNTNLMVEFDASDFLLVDCGTTASRSLDTIGISVLDVRNLFVSHLHADHIGGIEELALKAKLQRCAKIALYVQEQLVDGLWGSIRGGIEYTELGRMKLDDYFDLHAYQDGFTLGGVQFSSQPTRHVEGMLSFDLGFENLLLTSDTIFWHEYAVHRAKEFQIVVHDCSFNNAQRVHTYYEDLLTHRDLFNELHIIHYEDYIDRHRPTMVSAQIGICRQYADILGGHSKEKKPLPLPEV
jgi:glyoxylase-like metal-dependent hydrolase (beta-lactamase superfamily II)